MLGDAIAKFETITDLLTDTLEELDFLIIFF